MSTLFVGLGRHESTFVDDNGVTYVAPVGSDTLSSMISTSQPLPEELTNAIGLFIDHLDDVAREVPSARAADVVAIRGPGLQTFFDVLIGTHDPLPAEVGRDESEELFRTLATESATERRHNPGLPTHEVHHILGVSCAIVAIHRGLQIDSVTIESDDVTSVTR